MADQNTYTFLPDDNCLAESQLFDYIDGKLASSDMHLVEKHILSCGFCSDALDGLEKVKHRNKAAAFIPVNLPQEEKKEETKVIALHPARKYYAIAAGIVLILGITLFLKLSDSKDFSVAKQTAEVTRRDSVTFDVQNAIPPSSAEKTGDSLGLTAQTKQPSLEEATSGASVDEAPATFSRVYPADEARDEPKPDAPQKYTYQSGDANADDADDFVNVVDDKSIQQEQTVVADRAKEEKLSEVSEKETALAKNKSRSENDKKADVAKDQPNLKSPAPVTATSTDLSTPTTSAPAGAYSTTVFSGNSNTPTSTTTMPAVWADSTIVYKPENNRELNLSYENANKLLAAGQANASLALYDEVLKNPAHPHYQDAQWKKAEALIQLKRIAEAKTLLNTLAAKPGNYQQQAKDKLKTL